MNEPGVWQQGWQDGDRFLHPFYMYLLNAYSVSSTNIGVGDKMVRKNDTAPVIKKFIV